MPVGNKGLLMDLFDSDEGDFDIIQGKDWLHTRYSSLDF